MNSVLQKISITINDKIYLKNPEPVVLSRKVKSGGICLIDELGCLQLRISYKYLSFRTSM